VVENAQLHEIALEEQLLLRELALAHKVQQGLLPAAPPQLGGYEFFDYYEPASHLGGDYFDYIPLQGDRLAVALADVSGKGISAALLMARLSGDVGYCLASYRTPAEAVGRLNVLFCESRWEDRFVTLALLVLDPLRHELCLVNAGHLAPLLRRASGTVETVGESIGGLPLGVDDRMVYDQCTIGLAPGDTLVLYTDGIPEAMNAEGGLYGNKRMAAQLVPGFENAAELGDRVIRDVRRFVGHRPQSDDMCLTILRRVV
jgi:serine phosphatase RsbU (regulator of sigma subunit)